MSRLFPDATGLQHAAPSPPRPTHLVRPLPAHEQHEPSVWLAALAALLHAYTAHDPEGGRITLLHLGAPAPRQTLALAGAGHCHWVPAEPDAQAAGPAPPAPATAAFSALPSPPEDSPCPALVASGQTRVAVHVALGHISVVAASTALSLPTAELFSDELRSLCRQAAARTADGLPLASYPTLGLRPKHLSLRNLLWSGASSRSGSTAVQGQLLEEDEKPALQPEPELGTDAPWPTRIDTLFRSCVRQFPSLTAIDFQPYIAAPSSVESEQQDGIYAQKWTYAELFARATRIASALTRRHLVPAPDAQANVVVLVLPKSGWTFATQLGVVFAGSAWCPIDIDWPMERRAALLAKARPVAVITYGARLEAFVQKDMDQSGMTPVPIIRLDKKEEQVDAADPVELPTSSPGKGSDLAYLIWTSGTTGLPKAVAIEHRSVIAVIHSLVGIIPHDPEFTRKGRQLRYLQFSEYTFDLSILDTFYTFSLGGTLVASDRASHLADIGLCLRQTQATHTLLTPAVLALLPRNEAPALRVVINGGEKCTPTVAARWSQDCTLLNLYGPAEATLIAFHRRVPVLDGAQSGDIGIPLPSVGAGALALLPEATAPSDLGPVPMGAVAELVLSGPQLAQGYLYDDAKTADKFVTVSGLIQGAEVAARAKPLACPTLLHKERIYRTGDLVRFSSEGRTHFLGRNDDQVKIHGIRIEVSEITSALRATAADHDVRDSLTMALPSASGDQVLCHFACIGQEDDNDGHTVGQVRTDAQAVQVAISLRLAARDQLPGYMVPPLFIILHAGFPRTSSAKVDRLALERILTRLDVAQWESQLAQLDNPCEEEQEHGHPPELMDQLRSIVSHLTRQEQVAIGDRTPLASLGVDSVRAIALTKALGPFSEVPLSPLDLTRLGRRGLVGLADGFDLHLPRRLSPNNKNSGEQPGATSMTPLEAVNVFSTQMAPSVSRLWGLGEDQIQAVIPPTSTQLGMLAESVRDPAAYMVEVTMNMPQQVDLARLRTALQETVNQSFTLRSCFVSSDEVQAPEEMDRLSASTIKVNSPILQVVRRHVQVDILADESISILSPTPPVRYALSHGQLSIRMHHALYDAATLTLLRNRINSNYATTCQATMNPSTVLETAAATLSLTEQWDQDVYKTWEATLGVHKGRLDAPAFPDVRLENGGKSDIFGLASLELAPTRDNVEQASTSLGVAPRALYAAAWAYLLSLYFDSSQFTLGETISLRPHLPNPASEAETCLVSTVPLAVDFDALRGWDSLASVAVSLHKCQEAAILHPLLSARSIRHFLSLSPNLSLFSALFTYTPILPPGGPDQDPLAVGPAGPSNIRAEHAIALEVLVGDTNVAELSFDPNWMDPASAKNMLRQYNAVLSQLLTRPPPTPMNDLHWSPVLSNDDLAIHTTPANPPPSLLEQLKAQFTYSPSQVAVEVCQDGFTYAATKFTYADLAHLAGNVARYLIQHTPPGARVAVHLPRSVDTYAALLGILFSGRTYIPIDIYLPSERKDALLQQVGVDLVLTVEARDQGVDMNSVYSNNDSTFPFPPETLPDGESLACIMFTSGSTGTPKQVGLSHKNLNWALAAFDRTLAEAGPSGAVRRKSGVRFLARSAEAFDVHLLEALLPLSQGATVVTANRDVLMADLPRAMHALDITHSAVVPSLFHHPSGESVSPSNLPSLRLLIVGGERMHTDTIALWSNVGVSLLQAYGPTEATIGSSCSLVHPDSKASNVGPPFPGTTYIVSAQPRETYLDAQGHTVPARDAGSLRPLPKGMIGELVILGPQVARYLTLIPNGSFGTHNDQPFYRTGDLARMHADGSVEILGRQGGDGQIKINGVRIELDEVASALSQIDLPEGRVSATCFALDLGVEGKKIVATVSHQMLRTTARPALLSRPDLVRDLMHAARACLPPWMLPARVFVVDFVPLQTVSGKVNVKLLSTLASEWKNASDDLSKELGRPIDSGAPDTKEVTTLKDVFVSLLRCDSIPLDQDLFFLGLDSLLAIRAAQILSRKLGYPVASQTILQYPTVRLLGHHLLFKPFHSEETTTNNVTLPLLKDVAAIAGLDKSSLEEVGPTLPAQAAMLSESVLKEGQIYLTSLKVPCPPHVDLQSLKASWNITAQNHPIYRTVFVPYGRSWAQAILKQLPEELIASSNEPWTPRDHKDVIARFESLPALRVRLVPGEMQLLVHHALYDGFSFERLLSDLKAVWRGERPSPPSCAHASMAAKILASVPPGADEFWKHLKGASLSPFPTLTGERGNSSLEQRDAQAVLSTPLSKLRQRAAAAGASVQVLVTRAVLRILSLYTASPDVSVGLVLHGRHWPFEGIDQVHGPLLNLVPCRWYGNSEGHLPVHISTKALQAHFGRLFAFQAVGLPSILRLAQLESVPFDVLVAYQEETSHNEVGDAAGAFMTHEFPLAFEVTSNSANNGVQVKLRYATDRLGRAQADILLAQLCAMLEQDPQEDAIPSTLEGLTSIANPNAVLPTETSHFLYMLAANVERQPTAPAIRWYNPLTDSTRVYTYAEVDKTSSRIAAALENLAPSASVIGVHLDRDPDLYMTLIGVWKSGKGYLPIDPTLPNARVAHMLNSVQQALGRVAIISSTPLPCFTGISILLPDHLLKHDGEQKPLSKPSLRSTSYILFTSGSTGQPKGVHLTHTALAGALLSWKRILPYKSTSRLLQLASPGFDVSIMEICLPLAMGFSVASGPKEWLLSNLTAALTTLEVTMADLPAALVGYVDPSMTNRLEWLMSGGDAMDARVLDVWGPSGKLINAWGPTETTVGNTLGFMHAQSARTVVGTPYPASTVLVVRRSADGSYSPTLLGCEGEVAIAGPQLATGYVGRPDLTAQAFTHLEDGKLVYLTGDAGRLLAGGLLQILGRIDKSMVKINGQRVELDEVSAAFITAGSDGRVSDAVSLYIRHPSGARKQLVTIVTPSAGQDLKEDHLTARTDSVAQGLAQDLLASVRQMLAPYMIPVRVIVVAQKRLPLTVNNKVNRQAIEAFYLGLDLVSGRLSSTSSDRREVSDATPRQALIQSVVASVAGFTVDQVALDCPFLRIGLDSVASIALAQKLTQALGIPVRPRMVVEHNTVMALDTVLGQNQGQQSDYATDQKPADDHDQVLPCLPMQVGMLSQALASEGKLYVHDFTVPLPRGAGIHAALLRAIRAWDVLCLSFSLTPDNGRKSQGQGHHGGLKWGQTVRRDHATVLASALDLGANNLNETHALIAQGSQPWAANVKESHITLVLHHALYDATSMDALLAFLAVELGLNADASNPTPSPFAPWVPDLMPTFENQDYWVHRLESVRPLKPLPVQTSLRSTSTVASLSTVKAYAVSQARKLLSKEELTLPVLASLATAWVRGSIDRSKDGRSNVVLGRVSSLRTHLPSGTVPTVIGGCLLNTLPSLVSLGDLAGLDVRQALTLLKGQMNEEARHDRASLRLVTQEVWVQRRRTQEGPKVKDVQLFDTLFDYQIPASTPSSAAALASPSSPQPTPFGEEAGEESGRVQYGLSFEVRTVDKDQLAVRVLTPRSAHLGLSDQVEWTRHVSQWWAEAMHALLLCIQSDPESKLSDVLANTEPGGRRDLALPPEDEQEQESTLSSPQTFDMILRLRQAVATVTNLDLEHVLADTSLVELGIDSVMAIAIVHQYIHLVPEQDHSREKPHLPTLTLSHVLEGQTPAGIVRLSLAERSRSGDGRRLAIANSPERNIPLLVSQTEHLGTRSLEAEINTFAYLFSNTRPEQVAGAWTKLMAGHEVLRLTFDLAEKVAHVGEVSPQSVLIHQENHTAGQSSGHSALDQGQNLARMYTRRFYEDLSRQPTHKYLLAQLEILSLDKTNVVVLMHLHHALYDAHSLSILMNDFQQLLYQPDLKVGPDGYTQLAHTAAHRSQSAEVQGYWSDILSRAPVSLIRNNLLAGTETKARLPPNVQVTEVTGGFFVNMSHALDHVAHLERALVRAQGHGSRRSQVTMRSVLLASWARVVSILLRTTSVSLGVVRLGRAASFEGVDLGSTAVPLAHVLPLVVQTDPVNLSLLDQAKVIQLALLQQRPFELTHTASLTPVISDTVVNVLWPQDTPRRHQTQIGPQQLDLGLRQEYINKSGQEGSRPDEFVSDGRTAAVTPVLRLDIVYDPKQDSVGLGAFVDLDPCAVWPTVRLLGCMVEDLGQLANELTAA